MGKKVKDKNKPSDSITLIEAIEILDPSAHRRVDMTKHGAIRKKLSDWTTRGWIRKYGDNSYSAQSLITHMAKKHTENITSNVELSGDINLLKYKTERVKYQADYEEAKADIFDRIKFREEYTKAYLIDIITMFKTDMSSACFSIPMEVYGRTKEELKDKLPILFKQLTREAYKKIDYDNQFLPYITDCEGDRE